MNDTKKSDVEFYLADVVNNITNLIEMRISVAHAQIPCSFYMINEHNNQIAITISGVKTIYYFPYGNYNVNSFITQWNSTVGSGWVLTLNTSLNTLNIANNTT
jgi:hypothetical protein